MGYITLPKSWKTDIAYQHIGTKLSLFDLEWNAVLLVICEKNLRTFVNTFVLCIEKGRQNCDFEDSEQMVVK